MICCLSIGIILIFKKFFEIIFPPPSAFPSTCKRNVSDVGAIHESPVMPAPDFVIPSEREESPIHRNVETQRAGRERPPLREPRNNT